ncbi:MAG: protein-disulfide reductase DsbD domain-containing protein [Pseudomonadota bacterium]
MRNLCVAMATLALAVHAAPADAQQRVSTGQSFVAADLVVGKRHADGRREAGLVLDVRPGWKTYWRTPGEAGVPPHLDWSASRNVERVDIAWPQPTLFESFGYLTLGYGGRVVLPLMLTPSEADGPLTLALDGTLGVCKDICVFEQLDLSADIPAVGDGPAAATIGIARLSVPLSAQEAGIEMEACSIAGAGAERAFTARLTLPEATQDPFIVLEAPGGAWFERTSVAVSGGAADVTATLRLPEEGGWVDRSSIVATVLAGPMTAEIKGCTPTG